MTICTLISCMHQSDYDIIQRSKVETDCVVINQCNKESRVEFSFQNQKGEECHAIFISTKERGLSKSRNLAIQNAQADICLLCDDDEQLANNYVDIIRNAYKDIPEAEVISFAINRTDIMRPYPTEVKRMNFIMCNRTSSIQITFNRKAILEKGITFDEQIGSGTGNGPGEDTKWSIECWKKGLKCFYYPRIIATLNPESTSQWFQGYNKQYFLNYGYTARRIYGYIMGILAVLYFHMTHAKLYRKSISPLKALWLSFIGLHERR